MRNSKYNQVFVFTVLFVFLLLGAASPAVALVARDCAGISGVPVPCDPLFILGPAGAPTATTLVLDIIDVVLAISGVLSVLFIIIGGIRYITAHGNEELAESAKKTLTHAVIGIVIVILSFVIIRIIASALALGRV